MVARLKFYGLLLGILCLLPGCVGAVLVGTAAIATKATTDPRTLGRQIDDDTLKLRILGALRKDQPLQQQTKYQVFVHTGIVLLTGQAPNDLLRQRAEQIAANIKGVTALHNEIRKIQPIGASTAAKDTWITTKIRSQLLTEKRIKFNHVKFTTENGEVFLYGLVTQGEAEAAVAITRQIQGVKKVITLFKYLPDTR